MRQFLFFFFVMFGFTAFAQVRPDNTPLQLNPTNSNWEFYSQKGGTQLRRCSVDSLGKNFRLGWFVGSSLVAPTGNAAPLRNKLVRTPGDSVFLVDFYGSSFLVSRPGGGGGGGITALTGDVTASGTGSVAATIAANAVTNGKIANSAVDSTKIAARSVSGLDIALNTVANGNLVGNILLSKLGQSGASTNQVPQWNGSAWVPATVSGGGGSLPSREIGFGNGSGITSDTMFKFLPYPQIGSLTNNVLKIGRHLAYGTTGVLGSILIDNYYGRQNPALVTGRTANIPITIKNPIRCTTCADWVWSQNVANNNTTFAPGVVPGPPDSSYNNVMKMGFNPDGIQNAAMPSMWEAWEPYWGNGGQLWFERHMSVRGGTGPFAATALGTNERRYFTIVMQNLNNANYSASMGMAADNFQFNSFNAAVPTEAPYVSFNKSVGAKTATIAVLGTPTHSLGISADSVQNRFQIGNSSTSGLKGTSTLAFVDFQNLSFNRFTGGNTILNYNGTANDFVFGSTSHNTSYYFRNQSCNGGFTTFFQGDLTDPTYTSRCQVRITRGNNAAGWGLGYRSDINTAFIAASDNNLIPLTASFRKYTFGAQVSNTSAYQNGFFNIVSNIANTTAVLQLQTAADSAKTFLGSVLPNGVLTARPGDEWRGVFNSIGGRYHKKFGTGNTGWEKAITGRVNGTDTTLFVGINTNFPSMSLDVRGTDGIRISSGTTAQRPTSAPGVIRHNTDLNQFEGSGTGNTYYSFLQTLYSATSNIIVTNTTVVSNLASVSIPANSLAAGQTIRINIQGYINTDAVAPGNGRIGLVYGTDTIYSAVAPIGVVTGAKTFTGEFTIRVSASGASGVLRAQGFAQQQTDLNSWYVYTAPTLSNTTVNMTTTKTLSLFWQFGTQDVDDGIVVTNGTITRQ